MDSAAEALAIFWGFVTLGTFLPALTSRQFYAALRLTARRDVAAGSIAKAAEFVGRPQTIRERIALHDDAGVHELQLGFIDATPLESLQRFANEFIA